MKLCKDCTHYAERRFIYTGETLGWSPEWCSMKIGDPDPITGESMRAGDPRRAREDESMCGKEARWYEPGTLDGRLAALESPPPPAEEIEHSGD